MASIAGGKHGERPPGEQLEAPRDDHAAHHQQAVGDRVHERPQAAVLAAETGGDAVGVVAPADHPE
jgi:hypothetical protein